MPIRPENKDRYPANWPAIREEVLARAGHKCEFCGVHNGNVAYWMGESRGWEDFPTAQAQAKAVKIVLTIAHLDHTPENCDLENLRALCQRCHNRLDAPHRAAGIRRRRRKKLAETQNDLFGES